MADAAIKALRDESMLLTYLEGDRPICTQVSVRPVEEPEADHQADRPGDEGASTQRVLSERKRWRRDPDQWDEESDPGENQEAGLQRSFIACGDLDHSTPVPVRRTNGDHHHCTCEHERLRDPRIHRQAPSLSNCTATVVKVLLSEPVNAWVVRACHVPSPGGEALDDEHSALRCT